MTSIRSQLPSATTQTLKSLNARWQLLVLATGLLTLMPSTVAMGAAAVPVLNHSFESPVTPPGFPAFPVIDSWQKTPEPPGIPLPPMITWDQLSGVFPNTPVGAIDHIDNMDGNQAAYLFSIPGVGFFQDLTATYGVGMSYNLSLGVIGGGGGMPEGSSLLLGMYYRDAGNNMIPIGGTSIIYTAGAFPTTTHFIDQFLNLPAVQAGDAWAGRNIGVEVLATSGTGTGYWDVDHLQLQAVPEPSTFVLLALGVGGALALRLRRGRGA